MTHSQPPAEPGPQFPPAAPVPPPPAASPYAVEQVEAKAPPVAWLVPVAALLAVVGAFLPWFAPEGTASQGTETVHHTFSSLYSWKDGKIGLLAPIVLVLLAIGVVGLLQGRTPRRFTRGSAHPVTSAARAVLIAGAVSAVCVVVAWFMEKSQYKFTDGATTYSWDGYISAAKAQGVNLSLSQGPKIGFFLTVAAAVLALVAGGLMLAMRPKEAIAAPPTVSAPPSQPYGQMPPPAQRYQPPASPYAPPPAQPYTPPPPYGERPPQQ